MKRGAGISGTGFELLVLAGHDPTGGAGVDADREAGERFGARVRAVVTAWTDQDGRRVRAVGARDPEEWLAEARRALEGGRAPAALKTGLLPGAEHVRAAARAIELLGERAPGAPVVVDPVLAASGGEPFLDAAGRAALLEELLPLGVFATPNVGEAAFLADLDPDELARDPDLRVGAAEGLLARGAAGVVLKGGHGREDPVQDLVLARGAAPVRLFRARVPGAGLHGSGCRHATALAAGLAAGRSLPEAAAAAGDWLAELLAARAGAARG